MALAWEDLGDVARSPLLIKQHGSERLWQLFGSIACARADDRPYLIAQLGQSLDGRIAAPSGHSHYINGPDALAHLHRLRALVQGVVVGASTVSLDNPSLTVRRVAGENPARIVIDPNRRTDVGSKFFADDGVRVFVIGPERDDDPSHVEHIPPPSRENRSGRETGCGMAPAWIVAALANRGLTRLLIEGGATTVSQFVAAACVDRLHILTGPIIIGSGPSGLALPEIDHLGDALRPATAVYPFESGDVLFDCAFESTARTAGAFDGATSKIAKPIREPATK